MIPTAEDREISDQIVRDYINGFNNLTQDEKAKVFNGILLPDSLAVESVDNFFALCSMIIFVYRKYIEKHPGVPIEKFTKAFLKDNSGVYYDKWFNNILPLFEVITRGKVVGACGAKSIQEFKDNINKILNHLLPF